MEFLLFLLQVAGGSLIVGFVLVVLSSVLLTIRQQWSKQARQRQADEMTRVFVQKLSESPDWRDKPIDQALRDLQHLGK